MKSCDDVFAHHPPHLVVVGTDEGRELLAAGLTLEHDDGDALVISSVDGGRDGLHLIRGHNEQVNAAIDQTVNLLHLPLVTIVGGSKLQLYAVMEICTHAQLSILLVAPDVLRTLGDTDDVFCLFVRTSHKHKPQSQCRNNC